MESREDLPFQVDIVEHGDESSLVLDGEFDAHAAQSFDRAVDQITPGGVGRTVVDLSSVSFIDSSGLRSLIRARKLLAPDGQLSLRNPHAGALRLFELTGLADEFEII